MKCTLPLLLLAAPVIAGAQTYDFRVLLKGKQVGTMHEVHGESGVNKTIHQEMTIVVGERITTAVIDETKSRQGDWLDISLTRNRNGVTTAIEATPTPTGAHVVLDRNGREAALDYRRTSKLPTRDAAIDWFKVRMPKVGETASCQIFDVETLRWEDSIVRYAGPTTVRIGGRSRNGYQLEGTVGGKPRTSICDKSGALLLYELGDSRIERVFK